MIFLTICVWSCHVCDWWLWPSAAQMILKSSDFPGFLEKAFILVRMALSHGIVFTWGRLFFSPNIMFWRLCPRASLHVDLQSMPCMTSERVALCAGCGRKIADRYYLLAVDKQWHMRCLKCCECKLNLESELTCFSKDGSIYCKEDYYR